MTAADLRVTSIVDEGLGNSAYLVDLGDGAALAVDPFRDPRPYLAAADQHDLRILHCVETHLHADFVSGAGELAARGATVHAPAAGRLEWPHRPLADGDEVDLGGLTLHALATPGHTPEHLSYLLLDGDTPLAVFTGGALIVGGVARTDLLTPELTEPLARAAWRSIRDRLLLLPDDLAVYPTHGPGSFCSSGGGDRRTTTIADERRGNPLLQAANEDDFVDRLLAGFGSFPDYFLRLRDVNRRGPSRYGDWPPALARLTAEQVDTAMADGAVVVDVRPVAEVATGHLPGSLAIELRPQFGVWLGWLVALGTPLVLVVGTDQDRGALVSACLTVGHERLLGEVDGGVDAWRRSGRAVATIPFVASAAMDDRAVVDVRQDSEWQAGHIPGAVHVELGALPGALAGDAAPVPDQPLLVHCEHGQRSMTAATVLARAGRSDVAVLAAGPSDWSTATGTALERAG